jgi:fucose permease
MRELTREEVTEVSGGVLDKLGPLIGIEAGLTLFAVGTTLVGTGAAAYQFGTWLNNLFDLSTGLLNYLEWRGEMCLSNPYMCY